MIVVEKEIKKFKKVIERALKKDDCNGAMAALELCAELRYRDNQVFFDQELEDRLDELVKKVDSGISFSNRREERTVLFYDGFGLEKRGLSYIYVHALVALGYTVIYVLDGRHATNAVKIEEMVRQKGGTIYSIKNKSYNQWCGKFDQIVNLHAPSKAFFYSTPYDVAGLVSFQKYKKNIKTFLVNSTDQEYWLGIKATEYIIEFRNFGASLSKQYRKIAMDRLLKLPFYPSIDNSIKFQGYPFEYQPDKIIVFSGGQLYKTRDKDQTYYGIVRYILEEHKNVVFWYARGGEATELKALQKDFPQRVWHTGERKDLIEVLRHCDIYLNTFPIAGGLMMQYSAKAGRLPIGLRTIGGEADDILINQEQYRVFFDTVDELKKELDLLIKDPVYRVKRNNEIMKGTIIREEEFIAQLDNIINNNSSIYKIEMKQYDLKELLDIYKKMNRGIDSKLFFKKSRVFLLRYEFFTVFRNICFYVFNKVIKKAKLLK